MAAILDVAKPGERIFAVSFGSGAGSDGFDITVTDEIEKMDRDAAARVEDLIARKKYVDYGVYAKLREKIHMKGE